MRCARGYCISCLQAILVYLHPFHHNSLFCSQKLQKKITKNPILGFKVIDVNSTKKLVASTCYNKQHICAYLQPFLRQRSQQWKNNHFLDRYPSLTLGCASLLERRVSRLRLLKQWWKFHMLVILVYHQPFWHSLLLKCVSQPKISKNSLKPLTLGVQGHSRSSMLTFLRSSSPALVMIGSTYVPICNHFHAKRPNSAKITFLEEVPLFLRFVQGDPLDPAAWNFVTQYYRLQAN